jgi:hypothetical protein
VRVGDGGEGAWGNIIGRGASGGVSGGSRSERVKERKRGIRQDEVSGHRRVEGAWKGSSRSGRSGMSKKMEKRAFAFPQQHARQKQKQKREQ